jgi:hypothetical protein
MRGLFLMSEVPLQVDTITEARGKKREAAARAGREYLEAVSNRPVQFPCFVLEIVGF